MAIDLNLTYWDILWFVGNFLVMPFLTPVLTSAVVAWVLRMDARALLWGIGLGVLGIPLAWASVTFGGWSVWFVCIPASSVGTAIFLRWRALRRRGGA